MAGETKPGNTGDRVGVLVCNCGTSLSRYLDMDDVLSETKKLPNVKAVGTVDHACESEYGPEIGDFVKNNNLDKVIIASCACCNINFYCSSCTINRVRCKENTFKNTGLNKWVTEFVDIREKAAWIHNDDIRAATQKAKDYIRMGNAKLMHLEPQEAGQWNVEPVAVVYGANLAGLGAAETILNMGFKVHLVDEHEDALDVHRRLRPGALDQRGEGMVSTILSALRGHRLLEIHRMTRIESIEGDTGQFLVTTFGNWGETRKIRAGIIVAAKTLPSAVLRNQPVSHGKPTETPTKGYYLVGETGQWETDLATGRAAGGRAGMILAAPQVESKVITAKVEYDVCNGCAKCVKACPMGALDLVDEKAWVKPSQCTGCGVCAVVCTMDAVDIRQYQKKEIISQILSIAPEPNLE